MLNLDPAADAIRGHTAALCALAPLLGADGARVIRLGAKKANDAATPAEAQAIIAKVEAALRGSLSRRAARIAAGTEASIAGLDGLAAQVALGEICPDPSEHRPMHQRLHELAEAARIIARTTGTEPAPEEEVVPEVAAPEASPEEPAQEEATGLFQPRTFEAVWEDVPVVSGVSSRGVTGNHLRNITTDDRDLSTREIVAESVNCAAMNVSPGPSLCRVCASQLFP